MKRYWCTCHQEPILFSCSVAENIAYGATDPDCVSLQQIEEAARKANAYHFVSAFPQGFDTMVGERGMMLSGTMVISVAEAVVLVAATVVVAEVVFCLF